MKNDLKENLKKEARFLHITIPYDKDDRMITFDDSVMIELECDDEFTPPMFNSEDKLLEYVIDLKERKVLNWNYEDGYLRMEESVCWVHIPEFAKVVFCRHPIKYKFHCRELFPTFVNNHLRNSS